MKKVSSSVRTILKANTQAGTIFSPVPSEVTFGWKQKGQLEGASYKLGRENQRPLLTLIQKFKPRVP